MSITSLDGVIAGMQPPREIAKNLTGVMTAGRAKSLWYIGGIPPANNTPTNIAITSSSVANPTHIITAAHGLANGDQISIQGHTGSTPVLDGTVYTITWVNSTEFTIPVNVTVGGSNGVCYSYNRGAGAGTAGTTGIVCTNGGTGTPGMGGQIPFTNPVSGNTYLARLQGQCLIPGSLLLCDRLWENSGISPVKATEQLFTNSAQIPARDANGTNTGAGVFAGVELVTNTGATAPTYTVKYTNTLGAAGHTGTNIMANVATSILGDFFFISLQAGDVGIQKAESITLSATQTSGTIQVVLFRVIARLELTAANIPNAIDAITSGFPRIYNDSVPFLLFIPSTTTTSNITGHCIWTQG